MRSPVGTRESLATGTPRQGRVPAPRTAGYHRVVRLRLVPFLLVLGVVSAARGEEQDATWKPVALAAAERQDLRSPIVEHEVRLADGDALAIDGWSLRFTPRKHDKAAAWTAVKEGAEATQSGRVTLPGRLTLRALGTRYPLWVRVETPGGALRVSSALALALPLPRARGHLVDSDRDGVLGSDGDGYVAPQSCTVGPWRGEAWSAHGGRRFRKSSDGTWQIAEVKLPHPRKRDHGAAWCLLQWRRQQCGALPVAYDATLEAAMRKHAEYAAAYDSQTHEENPKLPLYTPEGDRAGRNSIIGWGDASALSALKMQFATLFHRTRPLQPGLTHTAIIFHKGVFMLNVFEHRGGPLKDAILVYPPHGMEKVRIRFHPQGEHPRPVPEKSSLLGTAVNVFSEPLYWISDLPAAPRLVVRAKRKKRPVEGHFHYPGKPPHPGVTASNRGNVALIPYIALNPKTEHACEVEVPMPSGKPFVYRWMFTTGGK